MDVVDEGFDGVLIFYGVRSMTLGEDGVFKLSDVALGSRFLRGVEVPVPVPGLALDGAGPSLLLHLDFVPHGDVLTFFIIMFRRLPSRS